MRIELSGWFSGVAFDLNTNKYTPLAAAFISPWQEMVISAINPLGVSTQIFLKPFDTDRDGYWDSNLQGSFVIEKSGTVELWNGNYTGVLTHIIKADQSTINSIEPWVTAGLNLVIRVFWDEGAKVSDVVGKSLRELSVDGTELVGTESSDQITMGSAGEIIDLRAGNDVVYAGAGDDIIIGGEGHDVIDAGSGDDVIIGGSGKDMMTGGEGADTFVLKGIRDTGIKKGKWDRIVDFEVGVDKIDLSAIDANTKAAGDQAFKFIGEKSFGKKPGQLHIEFEGHGDTARTLISGDIHGNKKADFVIELFGHHDLSAADFIL